jgi:hypothetical protein
LVEAGQGRLYRGERGGGGFGQCCG